MVDSLLPSEISEIQRTHPQISFEVKYYTLNFKSTNDSSKARYLGLEPYYHKKRILPKPKLNHLFNKIFIEDPQKVLNGDKPTVLDGTYRFYRTRDSIPLATLTYSKGVLCQYRAYGSEGKRVRNFNYLWGFEDYSIALFDIQFSEDGTPKSPQFHCFENGEWNWNKEGMDEKSMTLWDGFKEPLGVNPVCGCCN